MAGMFGMEMAPYMFIRSALGMRDTLTESDIGKLEQEAIATAIKRAEKAGRDYVTYMDYNRKDPLEYQIENSLGQFNFSRDAEGNYNVIDNYDFMNEVRRPEVEKYQRTGMLTNIADFIDVIPSTVLNAYYQSENRPDVRFLDQAAFRLAEQYGNRFLNDITFPVNINLPKGMFQ